MVGYEDKISIEYKSNTSDWANTCVTARWKKEVERFKNIEHKYILINSTRDRLINFPIFEKFSAATMKKIRIRGKYMYSLLKKLEQNDGFKVIFVNSRIEACEQILEIFDEIYKR